MDAREVLDSLAKMRASIASCGNLERIDGILLEDLEYVERMWEIAMAALAFAEDEIHSEADQSWLREWQDLVYEIEDLVDLYEYQVKALQADSEEEDTDWDEKMEEEEEEEGEEDDDDDDDNNDGDDLGLSLCMGAASTRSCKKKFVVEEEEEEDLSLSLCTGAASTCSRKRKFVGAKKEDGDGRNFPIGAASSSSHGSKESEFNMALPVRSTLSSPFQDDSFMMEILDRLKKIWERFNDIDKEKHTFRWLTELGSSSRTPPYDDGRGSCHTGSCPDQTADIFVGRSEQKEKLVGMLLNDEADCIEVIAVTGMGGIGKTTLSQHIYNDSSIKAHFDARGWVHVGESLDPLDVTRDILNCFTNENVTFQQLSELQEELIKKLQDRRFLLVLHDVSCEDMQKWDMIKAPLMQCTGKKGSKILLTSPSKQVALKAAGTCRHQVFPLDVLSEEDGWLLFKKYANIVDGHDDEELVDVGRHIFAICGRLPLAIKVMGSLLERKGHDLDKWRAIRDNDLWDSAPNKGGGHILKILYLSYLHLPPHLKACFKFFGLLKKGVEHSHDTLIRFWIAHGLIKNKPGRTSMKEMGEEVIASLGSRSLLEKSYYPSPLEELVEDLEKDGMEIRFSILHNNSYKIIVHDLIIDIARYIAGNEFYIKDGYKGDGLVQLHNDARHLCLELEVGDCRIHLKGNVELRTLVLYRKYFYSEDCRDDIKYDTSYIKRLHLLMVGRSSLNMFLGSHFPTLKHLHVLAISDGLRYDYFLPPDPWFLPESLYKLYNLVVLKLERTPVERISSLISNLRSLRFLDLSHTPIERIPKSICKLTALEELKLQGCKNITALPIGITGLTNLHSLDLRETSIEHMPQGLSNLTKLRYLPYYPLGSWKMYDLIMDLKCLELQGTECLGIKVFSDLLGQEVTDEVEMPNKGKFDVLSITCTLDIMHPYPEAQQVLELLKPHTNIKEVEISNFTGIELPSWMSDQSFKMLVHIQLARLTSCKSLSHLHQLPSLRILHLYGMLSLEDVVSEENYGCSSSNTESKQNICFPKLEILVLVLCTTLESLPIYRFTALRSLQVRWCAMLKSIHFLNPYSVGKEYQSKDNLSLTNVKLVFCPQLQFSSNTAFPSSTKLISVTNCRGLDSWCKEIQNQTEQGFRLVHHLEGLF